MHIARTSKITAPISPSLALQITTQREYRNHFNNTSFFTEC
jgi:hypothetical protein